MTEEERSQAVGVWTGVEAANWASAHLAAAVGTIAGSMTEFALAGVHIDQLAVAAEAAKLPWDEAIQHVRIDGRPITPRFAKAVREVMATGPDWSAKALILAELTTWIGATTMSERDAVGAGA